MEKMEKNPRKFQKNPTNKILNSSWKTENAQFQWKKWKKIPENFRKIQQIKSLTPHWKLKRWIPMKKMEKKPRKFQKNSTNKILSSSWKTETLNFNEKKWKKPRKFQKNPTNKILNSSWKTETLNSKRKNGKIPILPWLVSPSMSYPAPQWRLRWWNSKCGSAPQPRRLLTEVFWCQRLSRRLIHWSGKKQRKSVKFKREWRKKKKIQNSEKFTVASSAETRFDASFSDSSAFVSAASNSCFSSRKVCTVCDVALYSAARVSAWLCRSTICSFNSFFDCCSDSLSVRSVWTWGPSICSPYYVNIT